MDSPLIFATADLELGLSPYLSEGGTVTRGTTQQHKPSGAPTRNSFGLTGSLSNYVELSIPSGTPRYLYFAVFLTDNGNSATYAHIDFMESGTVQFQIRYNADTGILTLYRGSGTTLLATSADPLSLGAWHWLKVDLTATETGRCRVWADQDYSTAVVDTGAAVDCRATSTDGFDAIRFRASTSLTLYYSDIVVYADATTPPDGEQFLYVLLPDGDTSKADLTPSTGVSHYALVDEVPISDSDYNEATATSQGDRYTTADLPFSPDQIAFLAPVSRCTRDGTIIQGRSLWKSGATTANGSTITLPASGSYGVVYDIKGNDPNTSAAWTEANAEAVETGVEFL